METALAILIMALAGVCVGCLVTATLDRDDD